MIEEAQVVSIDIDQPRMAQTGVLGMFAETARSPRFLTLTERLQWHVDLIHLRSRLIDPFEDPAIVG